MIKIVDGKRIEMTAEEVAARLLEIEEQKLSSKLSELEAEANKRVEAVAAKVDREALFARTMHLIRKESARTITTAEQTELDGYDARQQRAEAIRRAEAGIKAEVEADADPSTVDVINHPSWP